MSEQNKDVLLQSIRRIRHLTEQVERYESRQRAPIAIIGMSCRFPGSVSNCSELWELLRRGGAGIGEVSGERWSNERFYHPDYDAPGKVATRYAGLLEHIYDFDPEFFGLSALEAENLDPQQRLLLEGSWLALEDAGLNAARLRGSNTGIFVGIGSTDHGIALLADCRQIGAYVASGNSASMAAGRLSYFYDFTGPALAIDTACSASLVAVHEACRALRLGECHLALAGGVNAILTPHASINFSRARMLTAARECHVFDARAGGYVRGEGCGVIVLKRMTDALRDGDRIYAVIKGSSVNHDGHTSGLTVPSGPAQEAVIRAALQQANLTPGDVTYIEAHGTGTSLGDPIEANALAGVFAGGRTAERPLYVGSLKANIGHLEAAAGIAGLIKAALIVGHREIPPQVGFERLNSKIIWDPRHFNVATSIRAVADEPGTRPLCAGVSSFGFSGTNAHVVLGEVPGPKLAASRSTGAQGDDQVIVVSAKSAGSLRSLVCDVAAYLDEKDCDLESVSYTSTVRRAALRERVAIVAASRSEASRRLRAAVEARDGGGKKRVALLFSRDDDLYSVWEALRSLEVLFRALHDDRNSDGGAEADQEVEILMAAGDTARKQLSCARVHHLVVQCLARLGVLPDTFVTLGIDPSRLARMLSGAAPGSESEYFLEGADCQGLIEAADLSVRTGSNITVAGDAGLAGSVLLCLREPPTVLRHQGPAYVLTDRAAILRALSVLFVNGVDVEWAPLYSGTPQVARGLPAYRFNRRPIKSGRIAEFLGGDGADPAHPLVVEKRAQPPSTVSYRLDLGSAGLDFLDQHRVGGRRLLPGATTLELMYRLARDAIAPQVGAVASVHFHEPVDLDRPGREYLLQVDVDPARYDIGLWSRASDATVTAPWTCHASARALLPGDDPVEAAPPAPRVPVAQSQDVAVEIGDLYTRFESTGVVLGEDFRRIQSLRRGDDWAVAEVSLRSGASFDRLTSATLILDHCFQASAALRKNSSDLYLLASIDRVEWAVDLPSRCSVRVRERREDSDLHFDITVATPEGTRVARLSGVTFKRLHNPAPGLSRLPASGRYEQRWIRCDPRGATAALDGKLEWTRIAADLAAQADEIGLEDYNDFRDRIEALCLDSVGATLTALGWPKPSDRVYTLQDLVRLLQVVPGQVRLFQHFVSMLRERGFVSAPAGAAGLAIGRELPTDADFATVLESYPRYGGETAFVRRCAAALAGVLCGRQDPLTVLFRGEALAGTEEIYLSSPISKVLNDLIARVAAGLGTAARPLRILEIGAGTGATARSVLARLPRERLESYCYTDISPLFLDRARQLFSAHEAVEYRLLNIEEPVAPQGFVPGSFDLIIAANVLHATRSLEETLGHVRELLAPGGYLVLRECIKPQLSADISFGMTAGWWRFEDRELRHSYALLGAQEWLELLGNAGFAEPRSLLPKPGSAEAVIVARGAASRGAERWLIVHGGQRTAGALLEQLVAATDHCSELRLDGGEGGAVAERLQATLSPLPAPLYDHFVYFPGASAVTGAAAPDPAARATRLYEEAIAVCQTGLAAAPLRNAKLWCVTTSAEKVIAADRLDGLAESVLTGVIKTAALEYPGQIGGVLDLESDDGTSAGWVIELIKRPRRQGYLAIRGGEVYRPRLEALDESAAAPGSAGLAPSVAAPVGAVLVTGGLGGIGFAVAERLSRGDGTTLILVGRDVAPRSIDSRLAQLRGHGARVSYFAADIGNESQVRRLFADLAQRGIVVAHIIHAAGVGGDEALRDITPGQHPDITAPKIAGTWYLSRYCDPIAIRSFTVLSTMVALWGARGKTHYVLANHFADRVIHHRRSRGLPGLTLQLGPVRGGMLSEAGELAARRVGAAAFDVEVVAAVVADSYASRGGEVALLDMDWATFKPYYEQTWIGALFESVPSPGTGMPGPKQAPSAAAPSGDFGHRYRALPAGARESLLNEIVMTALRATLGATPEGSDITRIGFHDLGMDSLMTLSFARALADRSGVAVSSIDIFDNANVANLVRWLTQRLSGPTAQPARVTSSPAESAPSGEGDLENEMLELQELLEK